MAQQDGYAEHPPFTFRQPERSSAVIAQTAEYVGATTVARRIAEIKTEFGKMALATKTPHPVIGTPEPISQRVVSMGPARFSSFTSGLSRDMFGQNINADNGSSWNNKVKAKLARQAR